MPKLTVVIPHWPFDEEVDAALRRCVGSLPPDCEKIVVVNDGTGFGRNVNTGLGLAQGESRSSTTTPASPRATSTTSASPEPLRARW